MHILCRLGIHLWQRKFVKGPFRTVMRLQCIYCDKRENHMVSHARKWIRLWKVKAMHAGKQQDWQTPTELFKWIEEQMGFEFTLDPCTSPDNNLNTPKFYTEEDDGLKQTWVDQKVFMNPPYGDLPAWIKKAHEEAVWGDTTVVGLLPVRVSPKYMRAYVWTEFATLLHKLSDAQDLKEGEIGVFFLPKRVRFIDPATGQKTGSPYFDSMVVVWK